MPPTWKLKSDDPSTGSDSIESALETLLLLRGIATPEERERFLEPDYDRDLHDPFLFTSMERVTERFAKARDAGERVGLFGDFDADGITST